jgi:hypothetical protein
MEYKQALTLRIYEQRYANLYCKSSDLSCTN